MPYSARGSGDDAVGIASERVSCDARQELTGKLHCLGDDLLISATAGSLGRAALCGCLARPAISSHCDCCATSGSIERSSCLSCMRCRTEYNMMQRHNAEHGSRSKIEACRIESASAAPRTATDRGEDRQPVRKIQTRPRSARPHPPAGREIQAGDFGGGISGDLSRNGKNTTRKGESSLIYVKSTGSRGGANASS